MKWKSDAKYGVPVENGTVFGCEIGEIYIHQIHGIDGWYLTCREIDINSRALKSENFDNAVAEAKDIIRQKINDLTEKYSTFFNDCSETELVKWF